MRKTILLAVFSLFFSQWLSAQCTQCHDGMHFHDSTKPDVPTLISPHNGSGTLGQCYIQQNVCGLAYVSASAMTTTRYTTPGTGFPTTLTVAGLPTTCLTILKAYLFYGVSYTEGAAPATSATVTNPSAGNGTYAAVTAGTAGPVCWGETGTASYCADITAIITTNGNYKVNLTGFANADYEVDGVTMIIVYTSPQTWTGSIVLYDGCMSNSTGAPMSFTGTGFNVCAATATADAFGCMGDMQNNAGPNNVDTYNGSTVTFPNNFWNFNDVPTSLTTGQTSCVYNSYTNDGTSASDCWEWDMAGLYWQNTGCTTCSASGLTITMSQTNPSCGGNNGTATATVTGGSSPYSYTWSNGQTTSSATGLTAGTYTVSVKDVACNTGTATVVLVAGNGPRDSITAQTPVSCFGGNNGTATIGVKGGTGPYTYAWTPSGGTGATGTGMAAGTYTVTITDATGCSSTGTVTITQPPKLTVNAAAIGATCNGICNGQLICIPAGGTGPYNYSWSNGVTAASVVGICSGTFSIVVTDANGCTADSTGLLVTQPTPVTATTTLDTSHCGNADGGACVTASGGSPGYTYLWSNGATASCMNNVLAASYSVIISDANKCNDTVKLTVPNVSGDSAGITATTNVTCNGGNNGSITANGYNGTGPYTYSWAPSGGVAATATGLKAGTYTVTVTDATGCPATAVTTITQPALVVATAPAPQTICIGGNTTLTATAAGGTPAYTFTWNPGAFTGASYNVTPVTTTTYTITTTDANGCAGAPVTVVVTVSPPLNVTVVPNQSCCPGSSVNLGAVATGGDGTYNYLWTPAAGLNCSTCQNPVATPGATTQYTVTVTDACSTPAASATVNVTINPLPTVNFSADTLQGCSPLCVNFTDMSTIASGGISQWTWSFGNGGTSTQQNPTNYCYTNPGAYTIKLVVTSNSGCVDSMTIPNMINVYGHPVAAFTESPQPTTIIDPTISFTDQSTDPSGIVSWLWQFGDPLDGTSTIENPQYTFADTGTYCAELTVTNSHGCTDSITHCVVIEPFYTLYIPNAFSPNSDGNNDIFLPKGTFICDFSMYIFDRWGMQLYHTTDINNGWNGTTNGGSVVCQEDTYIYVIEITDCINHAKHEYLGRVSIVK